MRIYTCTPVAFGGGADFFERDSGLLCRGLQQLGIESKAVMPGDRHSEDEDDLIRTDYSHLESVEWWKGHQLDGLVLYAWGSPRYRFVAKAIQEAGIFLILNQDNGGLVSPLAGPMGWLRDQWNLAGSAIIFLKQVLKGLTYGLLITDPLRAQHLRYGDVIACVSPAAADCYAKLCRYYGSSTLVEKIAVIPHSVAERFRYSGQGKMKQVVCVGRWYDRIQKRPDFLMEVVSNLLDQDADVSIVIAGVAIPEMHAWHQRLTLGQRERVTIKGKMSRDELVDLFQQSQVFYSPSAYESFGIAAAESLCCGCSVVASKSVSMSAFEWFVSAKSGTLASADRVPEHVAAIQTELQAWDCGERDANLIAQLWGQRLLSSRVAEKVVAMIGARK
jgi:glycosyltransferase involved in cell wall biosynthesis